MFSLDELNNVIPGIRSFFFGTTPAHTLFASPIKTLIGGGQLYRLDLRLYEQWYGQNKGAAEEERIRHDQWIPLVPGVSPGRLAELRQQNHTQGSTGVGGAGMLSKSLPSSTDAVQGKDTIVSVIADAAAGRFGGAASAFPPLGRLSEVQEEEIVLVHSFLNSQPQIDALPPGRADYEDHVSKELHWIDRPRIDKLTAAGRLGRNSDRRQHMIPVSPRTGRAVPERPGNCSYNALSRGNKGSKAVAPTTATTPVGILKTTSSRGLSTNPRSSPASAEQKTREIRYTTSGDTTAAVSGAGGAGGAPLASSRLPSSSRRATGTVKVEDEVLVEDLSEPQSDTWSGGNKEGCGLLEHEIANNGGELSSRGEAQESGLGLGDGTDDSSRAGEEETRTVVAAGSTSGGTPPTRADQQDSSFEHGCRDARGPVAPARQGERQAWEGVSNSSNSSSGNSWGTDAAGVKQTDHGCGRGRKDDPRGEFESNRTSEEGGNNEKASRVTPPLATSILTSYNGDSSRRNIMKPKVEASGGQVLDAASEASVSAGVAALPNPKQMRRGGSEGSLKHSPAVVSTRTTTTPNVLQENTRLPQAPVGKSAAVYSKSSSNESPGPGWGPDGDDVGSGGPHRLGPEGMPPAEDEVFGKGQGGRGRKASEPRLYPGVDGAGGSLQQLARTPNPQQRRLPSPRPQQELTQQVL